MKISVESYKNYEFKTRIIVAIGDTVRATLTEDEAIDLFEALALILDPSDEVPLTKK